MKSHYILPRIPVLHTLITTLNQQWHCLLWTVCAVSMCYFRYTKVHVHDLCISLLSSVGLRSLFVLFRDNYIYCFLINADINVLHSRKRLITKCADIFPYRTPGSIIQSTLRLPEVCITQFICQFIWALMGDNDIHSSQ